MGFLSHSRANFGAVHRRPTANTKKAGHRVVAG